MTSLEEIWPCFGLRIRSGPLELSVIRDGDIAALVDLAEDGIHDPDQMPFAFPWTQPPDGELGRGMAQYYWRSRAEFTPRRWSLELVVRRDGEVVGIQAIGAVDFLVTRTGESGSWLGRRHQGRGTGTLMRQTLCAFVFDHLDFAQVTSAAFTDNPASMAVSRKVGFRPNGQTREKRREGELAISRRLTLDPADLVRSSYPISVEGVAALRGLVGLDG
jgi:RimJ/RimL family protein N-acetyltransferase